MCNLEGAELDLAVGKLVNKILDPANYPNGRPESWFGIKEDQCYVRDYGHFSPSTNWSQGGPLIEEYDIELMRSNGWTAVISIVFDNLISKGGHEVAASLATESGPTPLIAAMRALVASQQHDQ